MTTSIIQMQPRIIGMVKKSVSALRAWSALAARETRMVVEGLLESDANMRGSGAI